MLKTRNSLFILLTMLKELVRLSVALFLLRGVDSQLVELEPFPEAEVLEGGNLTLTCKVHWNSEWNSLKLRSSKHQGELIAFFLSSTQCQNHAITTNTTYSVSCNIALKEFSIHIENVGSKENLTQMLCEFVHSNSMERINQTRIIVRGKYIDGGVSSTPQITPAGTTTKQQTLKLICRSSPSHPINISWHKIDDNGQANILDNACCQQRRELQPGNVSMTTSALQYGIKQDEQDGVGYCVVFGTEKISDANRRFELDVLYGLSTDRILPHSTLMEDKAKMIQFYCPQDDCLVRVCSNFEITKRGSFRDGHMKIKTRSKSVGEITCTVTNEMETDTDAEQENSTTGIDLPQINILTISTEVDKSRGHHYAFGENNTISLACFSNQRSKITWKFESTNQVHRTETNTFSSLFTVTSCADIGNYSCFAENNLGLTQRNMYLMFECKPDVVGPYQHSIQEANAHDSISIKLKYLAYPKPIIKIFRFLEKGNVSTKVELTNVTVNTYSNISTHTSVITITNLQTFGWYAAVFENNAGKTEYLFLIKKSLSTNSGFQVIIPSSVGGLLLIAGVLTFLFVIRYRNNTGNGAEENERIYESENEGRVIERAVENVYHDLKPKEDVELATVSAYVEVENTVHVPVYLDMAVCLRPEHVPRTKKSKEKDTASYVEFNPTTEEK